MGAGDGLTVVSSQPIKSITASSWAAGSGGAGMITAPTLLTFKDKGAMAASLNIAGSIGSFSAGSMTGAIWTVGGASAGIKCAGSISACTATIGGFLKPLSASAFNVVP